MTVSQQKTPDGASVLTTAAEEPPWTVLVAADQASCPPEQRAEFRHELASVMRLGYERVLLLRLVRPVPIRQGPMPGAIATMAALGLVASWPYLVNVVAGLAARDVSMHGPRAHLYGALLSLACALMLAMAWAGWRYAERSADRVADLVCASPERDSFSGWLERRLRARWQVACGLLGLLVGVTGAYVDLSRPAGHHADLVLAYLPATWTGFLGGGVLYWVVVAAWTPHRLRRCSNLRLTWMDPASTPGLVRLCACFALIAAGVGFGVITIELAGVAAAAKDPPLPLLFFVYGFPVVAALLALYAAVLPFMTLSRLVRAYQAEALGPLLTQIAQPPPRLMLDKGLKEAADVYRNVRSQRALPIRTWAILQYVTGILASLIIFFVQQALR
ncbi:hypothetical protein J4573_10295 [Actinomadura barringtoniae]|uniref:Uncharacterized protein n=1 Tax=Actinomadura barringtoniae TaxID=1427535 RepID=A0A939P7V1_9ACTN|nr:hypothetical protein [Actinomadura barringtoniae]MBO2447477.1 hypothetical protein [Actinomadura barringtoniae]